MQILRDQAIQKLHEAHELLREAGIPEVIADLADEVHYGLVEQDDDWGHATYFQCIAGCHDELSLAVKKTANQATGYNKQYSIAFEMTSSHAYMSLTERIKSAFKVFWHRMRGKADEFTILIQGHDVTRLKDILKKL